MGRILDFFKITRDDVIAPIDNPARAKAVPDEERVFFDADKIRESREQAKRERIASLWHEACEVYGRQPKAAEWTAWLKQEGLAGDDDGPGAA